MGFSLGGILSDVAGAGAGIGAGILTGNPLLGLGVGEGIAGLGNSMFGGSENSNYTPSYSGNPYGTEAGAIGLQNLQELQGGGLLPGQQQLLNLNLQNQNAATNNYYAQAGLGSSSMLVDQLGQNANENAALASQLNSQDVNQALQEMGLAQYSQGNNAPQLQYNLEQQNQQNSAFGNLFSSIGQIEGMGGFGSLNQADATQQIPQTVNLTPYETL